MEAALLFPLVILMIAGMIRLGGQLCEKVQKSSSEHTAYAIELTEGGKLPPEMILRGRWYIK